MSAQALAESVARLKTAEAALDKALDDDMDASEPFFMGPDFQLYTAQRQGPKRDPMLSEAAEAIIDLAHSSTTPWRTRKQQAKLDRLQNEYEAALLAWDEVARRPKS
jgi:hypothetical protein